MASSHVAVSFPEPPTLGYHRIRGLGAPLRMMLYYKNQPFHNVAYGSDMQDAWFGADKPGLYLKNSCINLPYLVTKDAKTGDDEVIVTQSNTLLLYLGSKLGIDIMCDTTIFFHNHTVIDQVMDLRNDLMKVVYPFGKVKTKEEFPGAAEKHLADVKKTHLKKLENFCKGPIYMCGTSGPQSGDFHLWEMLDQHLCISKKLGGGEGFWDDFPKLRNLYLRFKEEPTLAAYFNSEFHLEYAQNNGLYTHFTGFDESFQYKGTDKSLVSSF